MSQGIMGGGRDRMTKILTFRVKLPAGDWHVAIKGKASLKRLLLNFFTVVHANAPNQGQTGIAKIQQLG